MQAGLADMTFISRKNKKFSAVDYGYAAIGFLVFSVLLYFLGQGIPGNDFWWHVKAGEWICTHGSVPVQDIFSWYGIEKGIRWTAHEWLSEVVFYMIYSRFGERGIYLFVVAAALIFTWLMWEQAKKYIVRNIMFGSAFFGLYAVLAPLFFYGRPHIFSFFLLYFELRLLYGYLDGHGRRRVFIIPFLAVLWSNFHGGSASLSYILCLVFAAGSLFSVRIGRIASVREDWKVPLRLLLVAALSAAAILVNPVGKAVFLYPYDNLAQRQMLSVISEWQSPDAKELGQLILFYLPIALMCLGMCADKENLRLTDLLIMGMFLLLFFRSVRFIFLWYIAAVFCAFPYVPRYEVRQIKKPWERVVLQLSVLTAILLFGAGAVGIIRTYRKGEMIEEVLSEQMLETVRTQAPERIFNDYDTGEALIFHDLPVFFDSRADLYAQEHIFEDGISLTGLVQMNPEEDAAYADVEMLMDRYGFDGILLRRGRPLVPYLRSHPERYELVFEDKDTVYFSVLEQ